MAEPGPTLKDYVETRFNLLEQSIAERFTANRTAVDAAFAAQKEAVLKAETATEKRFEGVNEFRAALDNQQRTLIPRTEVEVMFRGLEEKISNVEKYLDRSQSERRGVQGGWGYAVGVVGFVAMVLALITAFAKYHVP